MSRARFLKSYRIHFAVGIRRPFGPPLPTAQRITYPPSTSYRFWLHQNTAATLGDHVSQSMSSTLALYLVRQKTI